MAAQFEHMWHFVETCYYLSLAAERILLSAPKLGISDKMKGKVYSSVRRFRCAYEDWEYVRDYSYCNEVVMESIREGLKDLNEISEIIGSGSFNEPFPDEIKWILQSQFAIVNANMEKFTC